MDHELMLYEKYAKVTPVTASPDPLGKHKGLLITRTGLGLSTIVTVMATSAGATCNLEILLSGAQTAYYPLQTQAITSISGGTPNVYTLN